jgi:seryl-tRNA synthetase
MNAILQLSEAKDKITKMEADLDTALKMSEGYAAEFKALKEEYAKFKADAESQKLEAVKAYEDKIQNLEVAQKDFEAKVEAKATEKAIAIAASVGVPPVSLNPTNVITPEDAEKTRIAGLKGIEKVKAVFELKLKQGNK